jgi:aryl carrier-like protein
MKSRLGGSRRREFGTKLIEDGLDSLDRRRLFPLDSNLRPFDQKLDFTNIAK